jgi:hypothetical protein
MTTRSESSARRVPTFLGFQYTRAPFLSLSYEHRGLIDTMSGRAEWLEKQQAVWTRGFERIFNDVIEDVDKELKRSVSVCIHTLDFANS